MCSVLRKMGADIGLWRARFGVLHQNITDSSVAYKYTAQTTSQNLVGNWVPGNRHNSLNMQEVTMTLGSLYSG